MSAFHRIHAAGSNNNKKYWIREIETPTSTNTSNGTSTLYWNNVGGIRDTSSQQTYEWRYYPDLHGAYSGIGAMSVNTYAAPGHGRADHRIVLSTSSYCESTSNGGYKEKQTSVIFSINDDGDIEWSKSFGYTDQFTGYAGAAACINTTNGVEFDPSGSGDVYINGGRVNGSLRGNYSYTAGSALWKIDKDGNKLWEISKTPNFGTPSSPQVATIGNWALGTSRGLGIDTWGTVWRNLHSYINPSNSYSNLQIHGTSSAGNTFTDFYRVNSAAVFPYFASAIYLDRQFNYLYIVTNAGYYGGGGSAASPNLADLELVVWDLGVSYGSTPQLLTRFKLYSNTDPAVASSNFGGSGSIHVDDNSNIWIYWYAVGNSNTGYYRAQIYKLPPIYNIAYYFNNKSIADDDFIDFSNPPTTLFGSPTSLFTSGGTYDLTGAVKKGFYTLYDYPRGLSLHANSCIKKDGSAFYFNCNLNPGNNFPNACEFVINKLDGSGTLQWSYIFQPYMPTGYGSTATPRFQVIGIQLSEDEEDLYVVWKKWNKIYVAKVPEDPTWFYDGTTSDQVFGDVRVITPNYSNQNYASGPPNVDYSTALVAHEPETSFYFATQPTLPAIDPQYNKFTNNTSYRIDSDGGSSTYPPWYQATATTLYERQSFPAST